jgi:hypothetical protein
MNNIPSMPVTTVTGRNIAHAHRTSVERAFLVADVVAGRVQFVDLTVKQLAAIARVSQGYANAAMAVAADPVRRRRVEGGSSLMDAAKAIRPRKTSTSAKLLQLFTDATAAERKLCMRKFKDEAFDVVDEETSPGNGATLDFPLALHA